MLIRKLFFYLLSYLLVLFLAVFLLFSQETFAEDIKKDTNIVHWVSPGESLHEIARRYLPLTEEFTVRDLIEKIKVLSGIQGSLIRPRQPLLIPLVRSAPIAARTVPKQVDFEARGIFVNRYSMACQKMRLLVDKLIDSSGNTVILDGKDMSGTLSYPSKVGLASEIGANASPVTRDLAKLIHYLHTREIHVGVRLVLFYDPLLAVERPELALHPIPTGDPLMDEGEVAWVNPAEPVVQEYNLDIAKELAEMGVDEIQFDYIRFPTTKNFRDPEHGFVEEEVPRHKIITDFLARARKELTSHDVLLSVDVFGIIAWDRTEDIQMTGQKIEDLARHCDVISPMIYPSHFYGPFQGIADPGGHPYLLVQETCRRFSKFLKDSNVTLRPWIQAFPYGVDNFDEEYILEELRALNESQARGWLLWSAGNVYNVAWRALARWEDEVFKDKTFSAKLWLDD